MKGLRESLLEHELVMIETIAQQWGLSPGQEGRQELIHHLEALMKDAATFNKILSRLSLEEREALENLIRWGGKVPYSFFTRRYGPIRPFGPAKLLREKPWENPAGPAERLWFLGLVFKTFELTEAGLVEVIYTPQEIANLIPVPEGGESPKAPATIVPTRLLPADHYLCEALFLYLVYLQKEPAQVTSSGSLPPGTSETIIKLIKEREAWPPTGNGNFFALVQHMAMALGLITLESGKIKPFPENLRPWLKSPSHERLMGLWQTWLESITWNELRLLPNLIWEETGQRNDPRLARRRIISFLARCPKEQWVELDSFIGLIKEEEPDFQRPDGNYSSWYIRDRTTGEYLMGFEHWDKVEGALIRFLITGPFYWLGTLELGTDEEGRINSFRLSPWGEEILSQAPVKPRPEEPIIVRQDFTILVPRRASLYNRFQVERFTSWTGTTAEAHLYLMTRSSLEEAYKRGITVEMILNFLRKATGGRVPSSVVRSLKRWAMLQKTLTLRSVTLLEAPAPWVMEKLKDEPGFKELIKDLISPTIALVDEGNIPKLEEFLRRAGYSLRKILSTRKPPLENASP